MCDYLFCPNPARWLVHSRKRVASVFTCGVHLSVEVEDANTFDDPQYDRQPRDLGVRVYPFTEDMPEHHKF